MVVKTAWPIDAETSFHTSLAVSVTVTVICSDAWPTWNVVEAVAVLGGVLVSVAVALTVTVAQWAEIAQILDGMEGK